MSTLYEIVETADGEIILRRADEEEGEALVSISFSEEAQYFLKNSKFSVAKAMIEAGIDAASDGGLDTETMDADALDIDNQPADVLH